MQTKITDFIDLKNLSSGSEGQTTDDLGQQLDLFDSNEVGASKNVRKSRK